MQVNGAENVYRHLPYHSQIEEENYEQLQQIKTNLVQCCENKTDHRSLIFWNRTLDSFIKLKNPIPSKDLEIFISTLISLLLKETDLITQTKLSNTITKLLKRYNAYNRIDEINGEFQIDWKPLLHLLERVHVQGSQYCGGLPLKAHLHSIKSLIQSSRRYFLKRTIDSDVENQMIIQEMLSIFHTNNLTSIEEFSIHMRQGILSLFLPTNSPIAAKILIPFIFHNWKLVENCKNWDINWFDILGRLSEETFRTSNFSIWDKDVISEIFTQLLKILDLSVPNGVNKPKQNNVSPLISEIFSLSYHADFELVHSISKIIAHTLSDQTDTLSRYIQLIDLIYSYFHPSNGGDWSHRLGTLISSTSRLLEKRILFEKKVLTNVTPLSSEIIDKFSSKTFEVAIQGIYAKSESLRGSSHATMSSLSWISPSLILPQLLEKLDNGLTTINASHQTATSLSTLSFITTAFVNPNHFVEGASYLYSLLENSLPGIDTNDLPKTSSTFSFYISVFLNIPLFDLTVGSDFNDKYEDNGEFLSQSRQMKELSNSLFENFSILFIERIILFLSHITNEDDTEYKRLSIQFQLVLDSFLQHLSPDIFDRILSKYFTYVTNNVESNAKNEFSIILRSLAKSNSLLTLEKFITHNSKSVKYITKDDLNIPSFDKNAAKEKLEWDIHLLSEIIRGTPGDIVNKFQNELLTLFRCCALNESKSLFDLACKLARDILFSLSETYIREYKYYGNIKEIRWGKLFKLNDIKEVTWYSPSESEIQFSVTLMKEVFLYSNGLVADFMNLENAKEESLLVKFYQSQKDETVSQKETIQRSIKLLRTIVEGGDQLFQSEKIFYQKPHDIGHSRVSFPVSTRNRANDPLHLFEDKLDNLYFETAEFIHKLYVNISTKLNDDVNTIKSITNLIQYFFTGSNKYQKAHATYYRIYSSMKEKLKSYLYIPTDKSDQNDKDIRKYLLYRTQLMRIMALHFKRLCENKYSKILHDIHKVLLNDLAEASYHSYVQVRQKAQKYFKNSLRYFPQLKKQYIKEFIQNINLDTQNSVDKNKVKGSFHLIIAPSYFKRITNDWQLQYEFISALTSKLFYNESKSIQKLIYLILIHFSSQYYPLPFTTVNKHQMIYQNIITKLLDKITSSDSNQLITWKYQSMVGSLLYFYQSRDDRPTSIQALHWFCNNLLHDLLPLRSISLFAIPSIIKIPIHPNITFFPTENNDNMNENNGNYHANCNDYFTSFNPKSLDENQKEVLNVLASYFLLNNQSGESFFINFLRYLAEGHSTGDQSENNNSYDAKIRSFMSSVRSNHRSRFANFLNENIIVKQLNFDIFNSSNLVRIRNLFPITKGQLLSDRFSIENSRFFASVYSSLLIYSNQNNYDNNNNDNKEDKIYKLLEIKIKEINDELKDDIHNNNIEEEKRSSLYIEIYGSLISSIIKFSSSSNQSLGEYQKYWGLLNQFNDNLFQDNYKNFGSTEDVSTSFRFSFSLFDPKRYISIFISNLLSVNDETGDWLSYLSNMNIPTQRHLKKLTCLREILKEANYRLNFVFIDTFDHKEIRFTKGLINSILLHIDHPYLQVRESLASLLYLIFTYSWNNLVDSNEVDRDLQSILSSFVVSVTSIIQQKENSINDNKEGNDIEKNDVAKKSLSNSLETIILWMMNHFHSSDANPIEEYINHLLPIIFKSIVNNEKDLSQKARACLGLSALSFYSKETINSQVFPTVISSTILNSADQWRIRESSLPFIQLIAFHHRFKLSDKELKDIHRAVIGLLNDPQIEVREMASSCLSSILRGATSSYLSQLFSQFQKLSSTRIAKNNEQDLIKRNSGVLGLISLVKLAPYDIPDWYPPVLMSLVRHVDDPILISKNVKKTIQDFWRTHRDMWEVYKDSFTFDELEILNSLMVAPSYYA